MNLYTICFGNQILNIFAENENIYMKYFWLVSYNFLSVILFTETQHVHKSQTNKHITIH
jgi:hypothetical protein